MNSVRSSETPYGTTHNSEYVPPKLFSLKVPVLSPVSPHATRDITRPTCLKLLISSRAQVRACSRCRAPTMPHVEELGELVIGTLAQAARGLLEANRMLCIVASLH